MQKQHVNSFKLEGLDLEHKQTRSSLPPVLCNVLSISIQHYDGNDSTSILQLYCVCFIFWWCVSCEPLKHPSKEVPGTKVYIYIYMSNHFYLGFTKVVYGMLYLLV